MKPMKEVPLKSVEANKPGEYVSALLIYTFNNQKPIMKILYILRFQEI